MLERGADQERLFRGACQDPTREEEAVMRLPAVHRVPGPTAGHLILTPRLTNLHSPPPAGGPHRTLCQGLEPDADHRLHRLNGASRGIMPALAGRRRAIHEGARELAMMHAYAGCYRGQLRAGRYLRRWRSTLAYTLLQGVLVRRVAPATGRSSTRVAKVVGSHQ